MFTRSLRNFFTVDQAINLLIEIFLEKFLLVLDQENCRFFSQGVKTQKES